jgi:glycosyltransferase involved in cell wall biosynthesis
LLDFYTRRGFFEHSRAVLVRNPITFDIAKDRHAPADQTFRFLYLGQIEDHKGVDLLIDAFKGLGSVGNVQLHIVGSGSAIAEIQKSASGYHNIHIYGRMDRKELPLLFKKMNMIVVPSLCYENSPTVIFESFAFGLPVLASNIEGIAELIQEGENGITFDAGNVRSLQEKMMWCLRHTDEIEQMSKKTTASLAGLSLDEYIEKLTGLYRQ